jgi:hypothetical protein
MSKKKKKKKSNSIDSYVETLPIPVVKDEENKSHYINNKKFFDEMVLWKDKVNEAREVGEPIPPVTVYIGQCFMEIAHNLAKKPNFMNYQFKDDMIGDGIENCLMYCSNFDPNKSNNPFSYFTQIIYYAFLRRIQKEKKQTLIKYKYLKSLDTKGDLSDYLKVLGISEEEEVHLKNMEESTEPKKKLKVKKKKVNFLEEE